MNKIILPKPNNINLLHPQLLSCNIPLFFRNNLNFFNKSSNQYSSFSPKIQTLCISTPSEQPIYGGWDDFQLSVDFASSGESTLFKKFLNSLGINDKKYIFVYLLGFICALAVTRIRVSSVIALSASVTVFATGFIIGYVNGGYLKASRIDKGLKDEIFRGCVEKLKCLVDLLNGVDAKSESLIGGVKRNIENDQVSLDDLEGVIRSGESISLLALNAKSIVEGLLIENQEGEKNVNKKLNKPTKEGGENGFGLSRFISRLFYDKRNKNSAKRETKDGAGNLSALSNMLAPSVEEEQFGSTRSDDKTANKTSIAQEKHYNVNSEMNAGDGIGNMGMAEMYDVSERVYDRKEYPFKNKSDRFIDNQRASSKMSKSNRNSLETWDSIHNDVSSTDFRVVSSKQTKADQRYKQEILHRDSGRNYFNLDSIQEGETELDKPSSQMEGSRQEDEVSQDDQGSVHENSYGSSPSIVSDDKEFSEYLEEANVLLREAKQVLVQNGNDGNAEKVLYKSAGILSKAIQLRPMSLLAVGQLGNTYLLHGELKLRISRELRAVLAGKDSFSMDMWVLNNFDDKLDKNDKLMSTLVNTCEECEDLLIKAGRNYRLALSIDGNDMRALYNWGLALSFRGQLIADIGPGAARDADRVFLAAIDKFDAMLSKSNVYAPEALFRWGRALQQRSRLRPRNSKEKLKFLQQARRLYEDALDMDSNNFQVQEALSTCISELNFWYK
ncbi:hypothetical protein LIER_15854 [Lithospermum erythrorhizon]|uniref:Uncharacterized protein n=1 Tax=Lithospermum erythrorhizon TaxID=34254 RepID=A0AAV3Q720_LITER